MRIEHDLKLTFDDVLIRPKRSTLISRSDVTLIREFKFRHSKKDSEGIPIIASNMDHTGTLNMFMELTQFGMLTALCKFTRWPSNLEHRNLIQTIGLDQDLDVLDYDDSRWICLDAVSYTHLRAHET